MFDRDWKTGLLILIVLIGGLLELIKHLPGHESVAWQAENFHLNNDLPYSVHDLSKPVSKPKAPHILPNPMAMVRDELKTFIAANTPTQTEFDKKEPEKAKKKKKKDDDEWEEVIDPVTGQKVRRKKKKEDAKQSAVAATSPADTKAAPPTSTPQDDPNAVPAGAAAPAEGGSGQLVAPNNNNTPTTAQQWEQRLLESPNMQETLMFIRDYKENQVSGAVFYQVVDAMCASPNPEVKSLGVLCAAQTPSVNSFDILAGIDTTEPAGNSVRAQADTALNQYVSLTDLGILQSVLRGGDAAGAIVAAQKVDAAAQIYLKQGGTATSAPGAQSTGIANAPHFTPFVPILTSLAQSSNSTLSSAARTTLTDLQGLLGTGTSVAQQAAEEGPERSP